MILWASGWANGVRTHTLEKKKGIPTRNKNQRNDRGKQDFVLVSPKKKRKKTKNKKNEGRVRARSDKISAEQKKNPKTRDLSFKKKEQVENG